MDIQKLYSTSDQSTKDKIKKILQKEEMDKNRDKYKESLPSLWSFLDTTFPGLPVDKDKIEKSLFKGNGNGRVPSGKKLMFKDGFSSPGKVRSILIDMGAKDWGEKSRSWDITRILNKVNKDFPKVEVKLEVPKTENTEITDKQVAQHFC